jgi:CRP/FNR family cyclic AMP-dependent transcriptional regulator
MQAMMSPTTEPATSAKPATPEDPLAYLSMSATTECIKGHAIYLQNQPSSRIYLVLEGRVKILRQANGVSVLMNVYGPDEFFGESALTGEMCRGEHATALEKTTLMSWSKEEIEKIATFRPQLARALLHLIVRRSAELGGRIASLSLESAEQRLKRTLLWFAGRFGEATGDGTVKMRAFTHDILSQHAGTARESVTLLMVRFRREGYLQYSRTAISLHQPALAQWPTAQPVKRRNSSRLCKARNKKP